MANEITYTGNSNLFVAAALNQMLHELIVDRTDLRSLCTNWGSVNGTGSLASKIARGSYSDAMGAANTDEVTAVANTAFTNSTVSITVARQALRRQVGDIYELVGGPRPSIEAYAEDMARAASLRFTDMVCALFSGLSTGKGTTTVDLSVDDISDAQYALIQARAGGKVSCVLAPIQLTDFLESLRGEGGAAEYSAATEAMLGFPTDNVGYGLHGSWRGIDFWSCDSVATSGSDKIGAMFTPDAFAYMEGVPSSVLAHAAPGSYQSVASNGAPIFVEFERSAAAAMTDIVGNYYVGCAELEDARGVKLVSSAT